MDRLHQDDDSIVIPVVERSSHDSDAGLPPYDKLQTPDGDSRPRNNEQDATHTHASNAAPSHSASNDDKNAATEDLMHGINSFWALVFPVCVTMMIAAFVVVNYRNDTIEASMKTYLVFGAAEQQSGVTQITQSFANAIVIIGVIAVLTFGMALLYKFNCMKFLGGYIMFASTAILSFVGGQLVDSVINGQLKWIVDWPAFVFVMLNFGVVGVVSIFYQKGSPKMVQNGYLVMVSVILAWEFSMWPMWTTLIFCFMFACYDLCAVLTPCGPLKCLIGLIQEKQAPLPGLLYEADVRDGVGNEQPAPARPPPPPPRKQSRRGRSSSGTSSTSSSNRPHRRVRSPTRFPVALPSEDTSPTSSPEQTEQSEFQAEVQSQPLAPPHQDAPKQSARQQRESQRPSETQPTVPPTQALANRPRNVAESDFTTHDCETMEELKALLEEFYRIFSPNDVWKADQVADKFFSAQERLWILIFHKYMVCSCTMDMPCPVTARAARRRAQQEEDEDDKTIKLGLGDFIFYSVLVGRSGIYDFSTFVVSFLCIIVGLGGTLFLLSVLHKALPALPISIFLATVFYFWTQYLFIDYCNFTSEFSAFV